MPDTVSDIRFAPLHKLRIGEEVVVANCRIVCPLYIVVDATSLTPVVNKRKDDLQAFLVRRYATARPCTMMLIRANAGLA